MTMPMTDYTDYIGIVPVESDWPLGEFDSFVTQVFSCGCIHTHRQIGGLMGSTWRRDDVIERFDYDCDDCVSKALWHVMVSAGI